MQAAHRGRAARFSNGRPTDRPTPSACLGKRSAAHFRRCMVYRTQAAPLGALPSADRETICATSRQTVGRVLAAAAATRTAWRYFAGAHAATAARNARKSRPSLPSSAFGQLSPWGLRPTLHWLTHPREQPATCPASGCSPGPAETASERERPLAAHGLAVFSSGKSSWRFSEWRWPDGYATRRRRLSPRPSFACTATPPAVPSG